MSPFRSARWRMSFFVIAALPAVGCSSDSTTPTGDGRWVAQLFIAEPPVHILGDTFTLTPIALDSMGDTIPDPDLLWLTLDSRVATVSPAGLVTIKDTGRAVLVAQGGTAATQVPIFGADSSCDGVLGHPAWNATVGYRYDRDINVGGGRMLRFHQRFAHGGTLTEDTAFRTTTSLGYAAYPMGTVSLLDSDSGGVETLRLNSTEAVEGSARLFIDASACTFDLSFSAEARDSLEIGFPVDSFRYGVYHMASVYTAVGAPLGAWRGTTFGTGTDSLTVPAFPFDSLTTFQPSAGITSVTYFGGSKGLSYGGYDYGTARVKWGLVPAP
jgi:hypothetical protein